MIPIIAQTPNIAYATPELQIVPARTTSTKSVGLRPFSLLWAALFLPLIIQAAAPQQSPAQLSDQSQACLSCHESITPGIVGQWKESTHQKSNIGCYECHRAEKGDKDALDHNGYLIATIVSPKDCSQCHAKEYKEFEASHHADAAKILGSLDNVLAEVVEGNMQRDSPSAVSGCWQCHGTEVKVLADGKLDPTTWPNTGIGRINPDGSKGSCSACHMRHSFSRAQARMPENCGRCHLGPDHPQMEVYTESKHGIAFAANRTRFEPLMKEPEWIPGKQFEQGPTCSACHMGATSSLPVTHDVGSRISWTLRPPVSEKIDAADLAAGRHVKTWQDRRDDMQQVCTSCHAPGWVTNWYQQFDNVVNLYDDKFGRPATKLYQLALTNGLMSNVDFDEKIKFTYYELWHHQGRRVRHGAAMMGPDYTQWHGNYEVAKTFYSEFVPQLRDVIQRNLTSKDAAKIAGAKKVQAELDVVLNSDMHRWSLDKMTPEERAARQKAADEFKKRYAQPQP